MQKTGICRTLYGRVFLNQNWSFIMKVTVMMCVGLFISAQLLLAAPGYGQEYEKKIISLHYSQAQIKKIFSEIEKKADVVIMFEATDAFKKEKATISVDNLTVADILNQLLHSKGIDWAIRGNIIRLYKSKADSSSTITPGQASTTASSGQIQQSPPPVDITGRVTNREGEPLSGASIVNKRTGKGDTADVDGRFRIKNVNNDDVIEVSYTGYTKQTIKAGGKTNLTIILDIAVNGLEETVVIAYQSTRKRDLLAASSFITTRDIKDNPVNNAAQVLQGRLAGVQVTMSEGIPGADAVINIRGRGSITQDGDPLYVVDGVPTDNALQLLNPQDIESLVVLKDAASTAIYGSRGANGVVVITTKGGRNTNGKTYVNYNMYYGVQKLAQKLEMMDAYDFVLYQYERAWWRSDTAGVIKKYIGMATNWDSVASYKAYPNVDWQEKSMGSSALQYSHNVNVNGGNANTTYNLSLTANKQDGILINSGLDRKNLNFKINHKAGENFSFGFNTSYVDQFAWGAGTSNAGAATSNRLRNYVRYRPFLLPGQQDDTYDPSLDDGNNSSGLNIYNPLLISKAEVRNRYYTQLNLNSYFQFNFLKYFSLRITAAYNLNRTRNQSFDDTLTGNAKIYNRQPIVTLSNLGKSQITNSNVLTYSNPGLFNSKHALNVLVGEETQKVVNSADGMTLRYFPIGITADRAFKNLQFAAASTSDNPQPYPSSSEVPTALASYFSTVDYNYDGRYYAKFTVRADGTSIFSESNRWGYFPSGILSWNIAREKFFNSSTVSGLRLRLSYGTSGNNRITPFSYRTGYNVPTNGGYALNGVVNGIFSPANLGNDDLKWESQIAKNVGLDVELWKGKVTATMNAYSNQSKNLLLNQAIPSSSGYTTQFQNTGAVTNKGIELQLSVAAVNKADFSYNIDFNISFNKNRITDLGSNQLILRNSNWYGTTQPADYILKVGKEVGSMYGYVNDGFYTLKDFIAQPFSDVNYPGFTTKYSLKPGVSSAAGIQTDALQPGSPKFKDLNHDGIIDPDNDRTVIGHAQPKFFGGITQNFRYKNFDLSIFANFVVGNDVLNADKLEFSAGHGSEVNLLRFDNGRWRMIDANGNPIQKVVNVGGVSTIIGADSSTIANANRNAKIWFPSTGSSAYNSQSFAVENGSYLRINNVTLGYTFPKRIISKIRGNSLRIYATVNNLAIITAYTGYDPDASTRRSDPTTPGVDYSAYPRARTFVTGLNMTF